VELRSCSVLIALHALNLKHFFRGNGYPPCLSCLSLPDCAGTKQIKPVTNRSKTFRNDRGKIRQVEAGVSMHVKKMWGFPYTDTSYESKQLLKPS
jgi:hypothetical protein